MFIKVIVWTFILALLMGLKESEMEGKDGWAQNLPTFRVYPFFFKLLGGKPLTGYHIYLILLFTTIFHGVFLFLTWSLSLECYVLALIAFFFVVEDFLFFLVNPHFRLKNFKRGSIVWHKRWCAALPVTYWFGLLFSLLLVISGKLLVR